MTRFVAPGWRVNVSRVIVHPVIVGIPPAVKVNLYLVILHVNYGGHTDETLVPLIDDFQLHIFLELSWSSCFKGPGRDSHGIGLLDILVPVKTLRVWVVIRRMENNIIIRTPANGMDIRGRHFAPKVKGFVPSIEVDQDAIV